MYSSVDDKSELEYWLNSSSSPTARDQDSDDPGVTTAGDNPAWVLELHDPAHHGPFPTTPTHFDPSILVVQIAQEKPSILSVEEVVPVVVVLALNTNLHNHPCRVGSSFQRSLTYQSGTPTWSRILAEMSHLICQHIKIQPMGISVPDTVFNRLREIVMTRLARSPFKPEAEIVAVSASEIQEGIHSSWGSPGFCKLFRLHLAEVVRTTKEASCRQAQYFICEDSGHHLGIIQSGLTESDKMTLLAQMTFSQQYGCRLLHQFTKEGKTLWFGNHAFAFLIQKSLYDIACPGWCGALGEMTLPDTNNVAMCQLTEVSVYTVASQIAWLVHVARFYLETMLQRCTTFRPTKRRAGGSSEPSSTSPWLDWTETLNVEVSNDAKIVAQFIAGLLAPNAVGQEMKEAFEKFQLYTDFIARPSDIPHHGNLGSFLYADPLPLLIDDQRILNTSELVA